MVPSIQTNETMKKYVKLNKICNHFRTSSNNQDLYIDKILVIRNFNKKSKLNFRITTVKHIISNKTLKKIYLSIYENSNFSSNNNHFIRVSFYNQKSFN